MSNDIDLRELAIDRGSTGQPLLQAKQHILTRYVMPCLLVLGFLSLLAWASRDIIFPPISVTVVPVFSTTAEVRQEGTPLFKAAGWIEPRPTAVRVAALAPGVIEKLLVVEDQPVKAGEPVAEMVKDDARLTHDRALADLKLKQAELAEAKSQLTAAITRLKQPVHLEAALGEAEASLAKIETQLKNLPFETRRAIASHDSAQKDYEGKLAAKGVVAGVEIDIAKSKTESALALVEELRDRVKSLTKEQVALIQQRNALKTRLDLLADEIEDKESADAKVKAAEARVEQAGVVVSEAKLQLDRMTIVSPIDGRVFRLITDPGTRIGSGMTQMAGHDGSTVVTLYRPEMLQVRVDVRFENIPQVSLNQPVEIDNPALSSPLTGQVLFISSEADIQKNTLDVKVAISDPPSVFKPEMLVDVTFLAPKQVEQPTDRSQVLKLYVLKQLIHQDESGSFVWLADQSEGVARKSRIQTGSIGANSLVEILDGLTISSRIISSGFNNLKEGDRIRVTSEHSSLGTTDHLHSTGKSRGMNRLPTGDNK